MTLELVAPGLMTLVQAVPYRATRHLGMPLAGAADPLAMALANWLVGNGSEEAALETAHTSITFQAHADVAVGIQGAASQVLMNDAPVSTQRSLFLKKGDILRISPPAGGCRTYIALHGGVSEHGRMKAISTYLPARVGGYDGAAIPTGAMVKAAAQLLPEYRELAARYRLHYGLDFRLRITAAPESALIDVNQLCDEDRIIGRRSNRVGLELGGNLLKRFHERTIESSAVFPGTIQYPPSGVPFLLGADAQTTGGYPRIAQVIRADRHIIGQLRPGARVRFRRVEPAEAQSLYRSKIALIRQLQPDFRLD